VPAVQRDALQEQCAGFLATLIEERNAFVGKHQAAILEALRREIEADATFA
jgi:hypothetical protein